MDPILNAVLGYCAWTILLLLILVIVRSGVILKASGESFSFEPNGSDLPGFGHRLTRAQANCYEHLPVFLGVVLVAYISNQLTDLNSLASAFLAARVMQSIVHLISVTRLAVYIRFVFLATQVGILIKWLVALLN